MFGRFCWKTEISHHADVDFSFEDIQGGCFQSEGEIGNSQIKTTDCKKWLQSVCIKQEMIIKNRQHFFLIPPIARFTIKLNNLPIGNVEIKL